MIIGGIEVGCYFKITLADLARALFFTVSLASVTCQVEKIHGKNYTLAATLVLTKEEA